ncbi:SPOR domain-containing protein [Sanyastnella coralliicola]|uniref:SPOR domain-containing protein n=1 Tax=Sanyastnella coralliicola TaxID=3069118 RepID=UPI0027B9360D|nr:SPOR domain-containing protein [Longitalea sp. SCSIO 12813]
MQSSARILIIIGLLALSADLKAQDDLPWWKKMFRKETVDEMAEPEKTPPPVVTPVEDKAKEDKVMVEKPDTTVNLANTGETGYVTITLPPGLDRLDSLYMKEPPMVQGYRVQIYFGSLSQARELRGNFISENKDLPCYLVQNPPNFAVQIGDFRSELDAYRVQEELKAQFPNSIIVQTAIENP